MDDTQYCSSRPSNKLGLSYRGDPTETATGRPGWPIDTFVDILVTVIIDSKHGH